eukprot:snap_masked-scaffold2709_size13021-processed-gene-0.1 protein:Tk12362 transcript:snap_masked-scaffold2709_size13021-processed-gene-0.1-mRNA-1 annotation:"hypothetical protein DAPPUDRAFT_112166"
MNLVRRKQKEVETFDDYTSLCVSAEDANLRNMNYDSWLATLITVRILDEETWQKLLAKTPTMNLDDTIKACRSEEKGRLGRSNLEDKRPKIAGITTKSKPTGRKTRKSIDGLTSARQIWSTAGGYWKHKSMQGCPAKARECLGCGRKGHFRSQCRSKKDDPEIKLYNVKDGSFLGCPYATPDSGAAGSVPNFEMMETLDIRMDDLDLPLPNAIVGINGNDSEAFGTLRVKIVLQGRETTEVTSFCAQVPEFYLSLRGCKSLGIVPKEFPRPMPLEMTMATIKLDSTPIPDEPTFQDVERIQRQLLSDYNDVFRSSTVLMVMAGLS